MVKATSLAPVSTVASVSCVNSGTGLRHSFCRRYNPAFYENKVEVGCAFATFLHFLISRTGVLMPSHFHRRKLGLLPAHHDSLRESRTAHRPPAAWLQILKCWRNTGPVIFKAFAVSIVSAQRNQICGNGCSSSVAWFGDTFIS
jgi:hypothetical protein